MNEHLDDVQLMELLVGAGTAEAQAHLAGCAACAMERDRLAAALGDWREDVHASAERPAAFWEAQRQAIAARRTAASEASEPRLADRHPAAASGAEPHTLGSGSQWGTGARNVRWKIAAVAAALLLVVGLALRPERPAASVIAAATPAMPVRVSPSAASATADDALLVGVEDALSRRAPAALAPAEALLQELDRGAPRSGVS